MMKKLLLLLFFASAVFIPAVSQELPYNPEEYIEWNEHYKLTWDAFLGDAEDDIFGDAGTAIKIQANPYVIGREVHYDVYALFNKNKSWYKEKSPELLAHEQLHFDIAELTARQVRKVAEQLRVAGEKDPDKYNEAIEKVLKASNAFDALYDKETLHGLIDKKQTEWVLLVQKELQQLNDYSKSKSVVKTSQHRY